MTFTTAQQKKHRQEFIDECRAKAWGAACHADWIGKNLDGLIAEYCKLQEKDKTLKADIKELGAAVDSHTVENRNKRKDLQEQRNKLAPEMQMMAKNAAQVQQAMTQLLGSVESNLALAKHAEAWTWKEADAGAKVEGDEAQGE
jgi:uncharacterized protein (DUF3084 family)